MKNPYLKLPLVLCAVGVISGASLYFVYNKTKVAIEKQEANSRVTAIAKVFIDGYGATENILGKDGSILCTKVWQGKEKTDEPDYFAVMGKGLGYNSAVPIELLVGFTNPKKPSKYSGNRSEFILVGWSVTKSEETPGLGEKIKDSKASCTWSGKLTDSAVEKQNDMRTKFQRQFADIKSNKYYTSSELTLSKDGGPIDVITGATYTSVGVISAIKDAENNLKKAF